MAQQELLRNTSNSNLQESEDFEMIDSNSANTVDSRKNEGYSNSANIVENEDDDYTDFANESYGESDSDESDTERGDNNEDDTPSQRLASFPANIRIMYTGRDVPDLCKNIDSCKHSIFTKIKESFSQIFDEAEGANDISLEKRHIIYPVDENGKVKHHLDSGVAVCEADLTNVPFTKALEYLQKTFAKTDQNSNLVDLCIVFVPQDIESFPNELLPTMRKLHEKVTLLPIILPSKVDLTFKDEKEEKRRAIAKLIEDNGINIFKWKADDLILDRDHNGGSKRAETVYTKKVLTVDEIISFDNQYIYEDLQFLRSRAIELRKDRFNKERAKKRAQKCDKVAGIFRDIIIMCMILYTIYLFVAGVWHYAEWSVIPPDLASSLHVVSRASLKTQNQNVPQTIPLDNGETQPFIEVSQESSSRFNFNILNKKQYSENRGDDFEVIVTHNPPQILGRYNVQEIGSGRYVFDIDTTGSRGEVLVEIKERNGSSIKTITWVPKEGKTKSNAINEYKEHKEEHKEEQEKHKEGDKEEHKEDYEGPTSLVVFFKAYQSAVCDYSLSVYRGAMAFGANVVDEMHESTIYFGHQLSDFENFLRDHVNYWTPIVRETISNWIAFAGESIERGCSYAKESIEGGYSYAKESIEEGYSYAKESIEEGYLYAEESVREGYLWTKERSLNFARFIKDQYDEIYTSF